jgi:hypothetical protein
MEKSTNRLLSTSRREDKSSEKCEPFLTSEHATKFDDTTVYTARRRKNVPSSG